MIEDWLPDEDVKKVTRPLGGKPRMPWKPGQVIDRAVMTIPVYVAWRGLAAALRRLNRKTGISMVTACLSEGGITPGNSRWHRSRPRVELQGGERLRERARPFGDLH
ncbi:hypothetical protein [Rhizobium sp. R693]|uniref:hypothetical protein n=1 Tax=Rhizobium sp. R693 TaxID=1764276 RepID=UPI000B52CEC1|nr:hypothetical protein [Rhizobium sp. R693]OWV90375.1 hypothetical protein ATY79_28440 [Rhizobium sp. R693]